MNCAACWRNQVSSSVSSRCRTFCAVVLLFSVAGATAALGQSTEDAYLKLSESEIDTAKGCLIITKALYPDLVISDCLSKIDRMARQIRSEMGEDTDPRRMLQAINADLFSTSVYRFDDDAHFLNQIVDEHRGNCLSFSCLYIALGERLGVPFRAMVVPEHMFITYRSGDVVINSDASDKGRHHADQEYIEKSRIPETALRKDVFLSPLTKKQVLSHVVFNRAVVRKEAGDYRLAITDLKKAIQLNPKLAEAYELLGGLYGALHEDEDALAAWKLSLSLYSRNPRVFRLRGLFYFDRMDYRKAVEDLSRAIAIGPPSEAALLYRGQSYIELKNGPDAVQDFSRILAKNPRHPEAYQHRGFAYAISGELDNALSDFAKALTIDPNNGAVYWSRAMVYSMQGDRENMLRDLRKIIRIRPAIKEGIRTSPIFERWRNDAQFKALFRQDQ